MPSRDLGTWELSSVGETLFAIWMADSRHVVTRIDSTPEYSCDCKWLVSGIDVYDDLPIWLLRAYY